MCSEAVERGRERAEEAHEQSGEDRHKHGSTPHFRTQRPYPQAVIYRSVTAQWMYTAVITQGSKCLPRVTVPGQERKDTSTDTEGGKQKFTGARFPIWDTLSQIHLSGDE
jgi:hypothetical protein